MTIFGASVKWFLSALFLNLVLLVSDTSRTICSANELEVKLR